MAKSMTAFGRASAIIEGRAVTFEIKSVNSRFLDAQIKISRGFSFLEEKLREYIVSRISRGKVDVYLGIDVIENTGAEVLLDLPYAESYVKALKELRDKFSLADDISVMTVAQNRDLFIPWRPEEDTDKLWGLVLPVIDEAFCKFDNMRQTEGQNLKRDLLDKKKNVRATVEIIKSRSAECTASYREKFEARLKKILDDSNVVIDEQRVLTECAIYTDKVAIDEEIVRLYSHFDSFDEIFEENAPVGRKLDFLLQEMNRETNTIGSKCSDADIAHMVVDIKCELEKIREQIQNIE